MGRPKALVPLAGRPLVEHGLRAVEAAGLEPVVVAKHESQLPPVDRKIVLERAERAHPLAGILAALEAARRPVVALGCDMPFVPPALLACLAELRCPLAAVELEGRLEPLLARYDPGLIDPLRVALERETPLREAVAALDPRVLGEPELTRFGDPATIALNVNDGADLERAERILEAMRAEGNHRPEGSAGG